MPFTLKEINSNTVRLEFEIPYADVESAFDRELRRQRGQVRLRGFRPGKVPLHLVKGYIGDQVLAEVAGELMQETLIQAVEKHEVRAVSPPKVEREPFKPGEPIRFSATFEVHEKPRDINLAGLRGERRVAVIDEAAVDEQLERLREVQSQSVPIDPPRPAQNGDLARLDYELRFDDKPGDEPIKREGLEVEVGSGYVLDEIAQALAGMSVGEERTVEVSFPAEHRVASLAGRRGHVRIKLVDLSQRKLPALDDEFARDVGEGDLTALRAKVRAELESESRRSAESELEHALLDQVVERAQPSLPAGWLEEQLRERVEAFQKTFGGGHELSDEERGGLRQEVERHIRRTIVIGWLAQQRGLAAKEEQIEKRYQEIAERTGKPVPAIKAEFAKKGADVLEAEITEANVLAALKESAAITDVKGESKRKKKG
ncbi:MAG: trigger factor [Deltaproteobacteria bacterium]|nr:trigger factor [Deltaproteobacteria bacterium]